MEKISFNIVNKFDYELDLIIEPFGISFELVPNFSYKVYFSSTKGHDISNDISIICSDEMIEIQIDGGWILFKLFNDNEMIIELEL